MGHRDLPEVKWQPRIALDTVVSRRARGWVDARGVIDTTSEQNSSHEAGGVDAPRSPFRPMPTLER